MRQPPCLKIKKLEIHSCLQTAAEPSPLRHPGREYGHSPWWTGTGIPGLTGKNFKAFVAEGRFDLGEIDPSEVSKLQRLVVESHHASGPVVDIDDIENFLGILQYPLYFLDYETYSSAVPIIEGAKPQSPIPFQFSLHVLAEDGTLRHHEYLADKAQMPLEMIEALKASIGNRGSIISWHKAFENARNKEMAALYPDHAEFLNDVIERIADLEDVFKTGYVDIRFGGSTSIKKVLTI